METSDRPNRANMPVRMFRLGEEPPDDLRAATTVEQRVEMVVALSARMLELTGTAPVAYTRDRMPVRVIRAAEFALTC